MRRSDTTESGDLAGLLGIPGRGSLALLVIFLATILTLALTAGGAPMRAWSGWTALALVVVAAVVVLSRAPYPLPWPKTAVVLGATTAASVLVPLELDARAGSGYSTWHILAGTLLLLTLAVRGRIGSAWAGFALLTAATTAWSAFDRAGVLPGLTRVAHETVALLAGTLFAVGLARITRRLAGLHQREAEREAEAAAAQTAIDERGLQLQRFDGVVRTAMLQIASGTPIGAADRASYRALEGSLRDGIRGRTLAVEPLVASVRAARMRGVDVLLLDDSAGNTGPSARPQTDAAAGDTARRLAELIAPLVDGAVDGAVTVRLTGAVVPAGLVASVVLTSVAGATRREVVTLAE